MGSTLVALAEFAVEEDVAEAPVVDLVPATVEVSTTVSVPARGTEAPPVGTAVAVVSSARVAAPVAALVATTSEELRLIPDTVGTLGA